MGVQVINTTVTGDCDSHFTVEIYNTSSLESDDNFHSGSMLNISVIPRQRTIPSLMFHSGKHLDSPKVKPFTESLKCGC